MTYAVLLLLCSELLLGIFSAVFSPARNALMPNLVHGDQLLRANSMTNSAGTIASLVGFGLGAVLIKYFWMGALYVDAATFLCSGILLMLMRGKALQRHGEPVAAEPARSLAGDFSAAVSYLRVHRRAVQVILLTFLFWCCGAIILSGLTGVVTVKFGKTTAEFSTFLGIVGVGMMAGAASCSLARKGIPKEFGIAWAMVLVGVFFYLFSIPRSYPAAVLLLIVAAFFGAIMLVSLDTLLQRIVPDFIRGRVMAVRDILANVGLVGMAAPLAIDPNIDQHIIPVLRVVAAVVFVVGVGLVVYYYRRQPLPLGVAIARRIVMVQLAVFKRFSTGNAGRIPVTGPVIVVSNHTTPFDPLCLQAASKQRVIRFMMAREYYENKALGWFFPFDARYPRQSHGGTTRRAFARPCGRWPREPASGCFRRGAFRRTGGFWRANKGWPFWH